MLLLQLLLSVQSIRRNDQVLDLLDGQPFVVLDDVLAGVDGAVVGQAARAVGRVHVRLVTFCGNKKWRKERKNK